MLEAGADLFKTILFDYILVGSLYFAIFALPIIIPVLVITTFVIWLWMFFKVRKLWPGSFLSYVVIVVLGTRIAQLTIRGLFGTRK